MAAAWATATCIATPTCRRSLLAVSGGKFKMGRHLQYKLDTPMTNLLLTMMDSAGVHVDKLGDSTGRLLEPLSIS